MTLYKWSQLQNSNAGADSTINWAEGQAPSTINDSARAMMAATAKYRDDVAGAIVTAGTSTAYTVSSYEVFDTLAHLNGQVIAFTPHVTNGDRVTLNVDGLGTKPLRTSPNTELLAGTIIQGTPYIAVYNSNDGAFYLRGYYSSPFNVPFLGGLDYWDTVAPNSAFIFPAGQTISRSVYSRAFARWGTQFGSGDGSTTFNVPDKRARVSACPDNMGGVDASRMSDLACSMQSIRNSFGGAAGEAIHTLALAEIPSHSHTNTLSDPGHTHSYSQTTLPGGSGIQSGAGVGAASPAVTTGNSVTGITITNANAGGGSPHNLMQPTILCNYIIRVL